MRSLCVWMVMLSLALGCAAPQTESAAEPEAEPMVESEPDIQGEEVAYEVDGVLMNGYLAYDAAQDGPRPGVLVVHEWWGHNEYARSRARMLAEMGYTALAVDMYGDGKLAEHPEDAMKFMTEVTSQLPVAEERFRVARQVLEKHPTADATKTAAIGYCFGGGVVLHMARTGEDLAAVASFHGSLGTESPAEPGVVTARVLVLNGAADPMVKPEHITAFEAEMEAAGVDMRLVNYEGAQHSFTNPEATAFGEQFEMPLVYDSAADEQSWAELDTFLRDSFGG